MRLSCQGKPLDTTHDIVYSDAMWSTTEAAEKMGISDSQCRRLLETKQLKGKKLGHDWVVLSLNYKRRRKPKGGQKSEKS